MDSSTGVAPAKCRGFSLSGADFRSMAESSLEKVMRLAGQVVPVRQYQRVSARGRVQVVRQHMQGHVTGQRVEQAGALKAGNVIQVGQVRYTVTAVKAYTRKPSSAAPNTRGTSSAGKGVNTAGPKSTASAGKGVNTAGPKSTSSAGAGVSAAADPQVILDAAVKAQKIPFNAPEVELSMQQPGVKGIRGVIVPRALRIMVLQ